MTLQHCLLEEEDIMGKAAEHGPGISWTQWELQLHSRNSNRKLQILVQLAGDGFHIYPGAKTIFFHPGIC